VNEAISDYQKAMKAAPKFIPPRNDLAWILATDPERSLRNGAEAVKLAEEANQLSGGNQMAILDTLGAAYAEESDFKAASDAAMHALELARKANDNDSCAQILQRLELYRQKKPYRQPSK
jgi:tetratricopeptide (TPR) repeat protein